MGLRRILLGQIRELGEAAAHGEWAETIRKLGPLRLALRRSDPSLAVRLTQALMSPLMREAMDLGYHEGRALFKQFTKVTDPLPIDPHWDRFWALIWEGPLGHIEVAEPFWRTYLDHLEFVPAIRPEERTRARALILTHIGEQFVDTADDYEQDGTTPRRVDPDADRFRRRAIACLEESLKLLPNLRAT